MFDAGKVYRKKSKKGLIADFSVREGEEGEER